jgi:hypothetical protein
LVVVRHARLGARDEDGSAAARLEIAEDLHPEFRALGLLDPQAEIVARDLRAAHVGEESSISCTVLPRA